MDTQHLQAFVAIAETGSFSAAAERLHLTQPAISKRIALLEEQLKSPLFDRIGRQIALTQAGQVLLSKAILILSEVTAAQRAIADLKGEVEGKLSIATSHHVGLHYLPPFLREFSTQFPQVKLDLHFLDSEQAYYEILQGRFDLAIITLALEQDSRLKSHNLWHDQLHFVAAPTHPLAAQQNLQLADLSRHPAVMPDTNTYTTQLISKLFETQAATLDIGMVSNHLDTIKMLLSIGLGWGVLPKRILDSELVILNVAHEPIMRPLGCIHHSQRSLNNAASMFLQLLQRDQHQPLPPTHQ
ncbi:LysR family transcriptional regulator [Cellvibrio mixtus]|jgi:DNA-binding transcriptional LysR family regulator|uniref:LysR family transcriptional regulator n=1 Tax=Cellvibrio mixtus TaxID=39650 RepID=A0A266Q7B0_9GAMM|nr:LysR family transcriptional regulator [Cellvibrio mixtus]OZY85777.1 LysR family transcriptional regulator [Cellvibrio mixtus]